MLDLLRNTLSYYQLEANPFVAPAILFVILLLARFTFFFAASQNLKNLAKDIRKQVKRHFHERSLLGWFFWTASWLVLICGYFDFFPAPFNQELILWLSAATLFFAGLSLHFLAYVQAAIQALIEHKSNIPLVS